MLSFEKALAISTQFAHRRPTIRIETERAIGHVTAAPVRAVVHVPPFSRSMMDGYAVRAEDMVVGGRLSVVGVIPAGTSGASVTVGSNEAVRIFTGAPVPNGADAILRQEWCTALGEEQIEVLRAPAVGESIQPRGEDAAPTDVLLPSGRRLTAADVAVCKACGVADLDVIDAPSVAILVTGSELVQDAKRPLVDGQIYGSNDAWLRGKIQEDGAHVGEIVYIGDNLAAIETAIATLAETHDFIISTGGVSVGDFDFIPRAVAKLAGHLAIEKVWMRPGSPFVLGRVGRAAVYGLSGNPAASFIQYETLVRPAIRMSMGWQDPAFSSSGKLANDVDLKPIKHIRILRATARIKDGVVWVDTQMSQSPGLLSGLTTTNCLVKLDDATYPQGTVVPVRWLKMPE